MNSEFNKKGIVLIYNDVKDRIGANCDSANLNHIFQRLPEFRDRYLYAKNLCKFDIFKLGADRESQSIDQSGRVHWVWHCTPSQKFELRHRYSRHVISWRDKTWTHYHIQSSSPTSAAMGPMINEGSSFTCLAKIFARHASPRFPPSFKRTLTCTRTWKVSGSGRNFITTLCQTSKSSST